MRRRTILTLVIALTAVLVQPDLVGQVPGEEEKALAEIRKRIADLGKQVSEKHAQRQGTTLELRRVERELGAAAQTLVDLQGQLVDQEKRQAELAKEIQVAQGRLATQQASLSQQIRLSYMGGRQEALRLLLNQESPARLGRMMVYYDYLNRARSDRIEQVNGDIQRLEELSAEAREVTAELARLAGRRTEEIARLERARAERRQALAAIEQELKSADQQLATLKAEEDALVDLVAELRQVLAEFPVGSQEPFASLKGSLAWPVRGQLLRDFGARKAGGSLKSTGVLLGADTGAPVRALYHGRVVFGDWLPGLGLLLVVDHGQGYMSLYGHNEALLKEAGDWVTPGEVIAQVGDTGGQSRPGLHFEIRRDGVPENPHRWINRRVSGRRRADTT